VTSYLVVLRFTVIIALGAALGVALLRRRGDKHEQMEFSGMEHDARVIDEVPTLDYFDSRSYLIKVDIATLDISVIAAFWYAGTIRNERMPAIAADLLGRGIESNHLGLLAGILDTKISSADIGEIVDPSFRELGVSAPMPKSKAQLIAACHIAREVINERLDAAHGAGVITELFDWDAHSAAGQIVRIHSDLVRRVRRNSPEEESRRYCGLP
jgi:hypothetical protein